jgi:thiaminase
MSANPESSGAQQLLAAASLDFMKSRSCRFIGEATSATLSEQHFLRYLLNELSFVYTVEAVVEEALAGGELPVPEGPQISGELRASGESLVSGELACALGETEKLKLILSDLQQEQIPYFRRVLSSFEGGADLVAKVRKIAGSDSLSVFLREHMAECGRRGRGRDANDSTDRWKFVAVAMFSAENLYWQWCSAAAHSEFSSARDPRLQHWIEMHTVPNFRASVDYWRSRVSRMVAGGEPLPLLKQWCSAMLQAESEFHDSVYFEGTEKDYDEDFVGER